MVNVCHVTDVSVFVCVRAVCCRMSKYIICVILLVNRPSDTSTEIIYGVVRASPKSFVITRMQSKNRNIWQDIQPTMLWRCLYIKLLTALFNTHTNSHEWKVSILMGLAKNHFLHLLSFGAFHKDILFTIHIAPNTCFTSSHPRLHAHVSLGPI